MSNFGPPSGSVRRQCGRRCDSNPRRAIRKCYNHISVSFPMEIFILNYLGDPSAARKLLQDAVAQVFFNNSHAVLMWRKPEYREETHRVS